MKPTLILFALLLLAGCSRENDKSVIKNLPGSWHTATAAVFTIAPNGDFTFRSVSQGPTYAPTVELRGTFQVKDGFLVETVTNSTQPRIQGRIPFVSSFRIIRADAQKMVLSLDGDQFVLRKEML